MAVLIGWADAYTSPYKTSELTPEKRRALIEKIRQKKYFYTYEAHQTLPFAAPLFNDMYICVLSKVDWDSCITEAHKDTRISARLMPSDVLDDVCKDALVEEPKYFESMEV